MLPFERGSDGRSAEDAIGSDAAYLRLEARLPRPAKAYFGDRCAIYNDWGATARTDKHDLTRSGLSARRPAIGMTRASRTLNRPEAVARACLGG